MPDPVTPTGGPGLFRGPERRAEPEGQTGLFDDQGTPIPSGSPAGTVQLLGLITRLQAIEGALSVERLAASGFDEEAARLQGDIARLQTIVSVARDGINRMAAHFSADWGGRAFEGGRAAQDILGTA